MSVGQPDNVGRTVRQLADTWRDETGSLSSPSQIAAHSAYQRIISMREQALPYIFEELRERGGQWYVALRANPLTDEVQHSGEVANRGRGLKSTSTIVGRSATGTGIP